MPTAQQYPVIQPTQPFTIQDPNAFAASTKKILSSAIPGLDKLSGTASANTQALMEGQPSPNPVRRANAYFGTRSGMPGSDFVRNRGFDLYGEKADSYQARGFNDFLSLLKGVSGTIAPTTGEQTSLNQLGQNINQRTVESNANVNRDNAQASEAIRQDGAARWNANRNSGMRTVNSLGMTPLFGWGSGR